MTKNPEIYALATACGATAYTIGALRAVRGVSLTFEQLDQFAEEFEKSPLLGNWIAAAAVAQNRVSELDLIINEVISCFDAAYIEGLDQALAQSVGSEPGSLHDLVARRIMPAYSIVRAAKDQAERTPKAPVESFVGVSSSADFDTDQWIFTMKSPYQIGAGEYLITPLATLKNTAGDAA